jgi:hypothetical protein
MDDTYEINTKQSKEYLNTSLGHLMTHLAETIFLKMHYGKTKESLRGSKWVHEDK